MKDKAGREIDYLRISITDRCNLRCKYCMPGDIETTDMENLLTYEEIVQVTETAAALGIRHIRLTGGEPLVRRGCVDLVEKIKNVSGIETVGMTTNGVLLAEYAKALKEAGLDSVNVSLDTLDETEFQRLTGRDELNAVLAGINAAKEAQIPGFASRRILSARSFAAPANRYITPCMASSTKILPTRNSRFSFVQ